MLRESLTNEGRAVEFKNGNINVKLDKETLENIGKGDLGALFCALDGALLWLDCEFYGEDYCISNYDMGTALFNSHNGKVYEVSHSDLLGVLGEGKTLKLYAHEPNEWDKEWLARDLGYTEYCVETDENAPIFENEGACIA